MILRKLTAILFLQVYLFNLVGYHFEFNRSMIQLGRESTEKFDRGEYDSAELIEIKLPLSLPYYNQSQDEFERYDGQVEVNGQWIDFVQRRVSGDTLYLLCLPNKAKTALQQAKHNQIESETGNVPGTKSVTKKAAADHAGPAPLPWWQPDWNYFFSPTPFKHASALASGVRVLFPEPPRKVC